MTENAKKIFEMLNLKPNEEFKIKTNDDRIFDCHWIFSMECMSCPSNDFWNATICASLCIMWEMANIPVNGYKKTWWLSETKEE